MRSRPELWPSFVKQSSLCRLPLVNKCVPQAATADVPVDVTAEMPSGQRTELYQTKAMLFITTRILVVDLLTSVVQSQQVAGLIILNAHRVQDTSGEAFAARLFRTSNQQGFIRAFSDNANAVTGGFARVRTWPCMLQLHPYMPVS